ncbi:MAG TPA: hypothetical protein PLV50_13970 [Smithella sp.]|nr:hypothetical protein [Smithella sp.]
MRPQGQNRQDSDHDEQFIPAPSISFQRAKDGHAETSYPRKQAHFPQVAAPPVGKILDIAKEKRRDQGEEILRGKAEHGGKTHRDPRGPHPFSRRRKRVQEMKGAQEQPAGGNAKESQDGRRPPVFDLRQADKAVQDRRQTHIIDVLKLPGEDLHGHGKGPQQRPPQSRPLYHPVHRHKDQGRPGHGVEVAHMPREDMQIERPGKHEYHRCCERGQRMQPPPSRPQIHEESRQQDMQSDAPIDG